MSLLDEVWDLLYVVRRVNYDWSEFTQQIIYPQTAVRCGRIWLNETYFGEWGQILDDIVFHINLFGGLLFFSLRIFLCFDFGKIGLDLLFWNIDFGQGGMEIKQFALNLFHKLDMIIVELCFLAFKVSVVGKLPKIEILPGETFFIGEALVEMFDLVDLLDLLGEFGEGLFHFVFLLDELHEDFFVHWGFEGNLKNN